MVDFIFMGLLHLWWARTENDKMNNSCHPCDSNPGPSGYDANSLSYAIKADKYRSPEGDRILPECAINNYLYRMVDLVKCFVV